MTEKAVNYTDEMVARMREVYVPTAEVEARKAAVERLSAELGKPVKSIVSKLVREGLYVKAERTAKDGAPVETKEAIATEIGEILGLAENDASSLAKATKRALKAVREAIR